MTKEEATPAIAQSTTEDKAVEDTVAPAAKGKKKKIRRSVPHGQVHINATFNNTIITFTDQNGGALVATSSGACGFRGSKKGTAYAAQIAMDKVVDGAKQQHGLVKADVFVIGIGQGRDAAIRSLVSRDIQIESITDNTGTPHGGTRPRKARRN